MRGLGQSTAIVGLVQLTSAPAYSAPVAPAGYWVNPANPTQWLSQADAAKIGRYCMQGPSIGVYDVGRNYQNSVLFCRNLSCQQGVMIYGAIAAALFLFAPGGWKAAAIVPAGLMAMDCLFPGDL